jgi:hypothetical protein
LYQENVTGTLIFSSPATVSGGNQLALCNGVEEGGEEEAIEDVEAFGVGLAKGAHGLA